MGQITRLVIAGALFASTTAVGQDNESDASPPPPLDADYTELIESAFGAIRGIETKIWQNWPDAPDRILFMTGEHEYLAAADPPPEGTKFAGTAQNIDGKSLFAREAVFPPTLLASFPIYNGVPVIVIGAPEISDLTPEAWTAIVSHEHFHQLQASRPDYYQHVDALDLAGDDTTGQWMIDYPFPYDQPFIGRLFGEMGAELASTWQAMGDLAFGGDVLFREAIERYLAARAAFRDAVNPDDYRYFAFQVWQEGVARYTEYRVATTLAANANPGSHGFSRPEFQKRADLLIKNSMETLRNPDSLAELNRVAFYAVGHIEAMVLDEAVGEWQERYFDGRLSTDGLFDPEG